MNYLSVDMQTFEVLKDISLLYVEDDAATREELTMILEPWLGKLHVASDGQAGLALFTQQRPDIVVTDIQMPKINGLVMSGKIREIVPGQAIVVVSAYNDVEYLFKAIELGIDHYVTKPVNVELLLKKLAAMALPVSVNIDAIHLEQADFVERLRQQLSRHPGVVGGDLELEVLETSALQDIAHVSSVILACQELGVGFALDDFGTGYSSLTYLKRLPAGMLKVDQSFVRDMLEDPDDLAILDGVLGLANAFRRKAIAEGVETLAHGEVLLRLDRPLAQGYAIAHPMPPADLPNWLASWRPDVAWLGRAQIRREDMPILYAWVEHRAWIASVTGYLQGERGDSPPLDCKACRVGQWLGNAREHHADHSLNRGRERFPPSPPSEPGVRFSRDGLSSQLFPHRDWRANL